jgi:hypothetical protein
MVFVSIVDCVDVRCVCICVQEGKLATFVNRINTEWGLVFTELQGENVELQPPSVPVPATIRSFSACGSQ